MFDYIEKMMRTAGVEKQRDCEYLDNCPYAFSHNCSDCSMGFKQSYPDFTPAKQLEAIKLIKVDINTYGLDWCLAALTSKGMIAKVYPDFAQALALLTIELMNAGELDKQKVKEILEG